MKRLSIQSISTATELVGFGMIDWAAFRVSFTLGAFLAGVLLVLLGAFVLVEPQRRGSRR